MSEVVGAFWVIPDSLEESVQAKISEIVTEHPSLDDDSTRASLRHDLLKVYSEHGHLNVTIMPGEDHDQ